MKQFETIFAEIEKVNQVRNSLFDVKKIRLHTGLEGFESPENFGIYRSTGGSALGVVGKVYEPTQPTMLFDGLIEGLSEIDNIDYNTLSYSELKGGSKIKLSVEIGKMSFVNMAGKDDELKIALNLQTGFDGTTKTSMFISVFRMICKNGMKGWRTEMEVSVKNTLGNIGKIGALTNEVALMYNEKENFIEFIKSMNSFKVTKKHQDAFLQKVVGMNGKEYSELTTRKRNIFDAINQSCAIEMKRTGNTMWGLLNGITNYTNHVASKNDTENYIYADSGLKLNNEAQKFALELMN